MSAPLDSVTPELRDTLSNFAAGLFGLDAWIKEPAQYKPDGRPSVARVRSHVTRSDLAGSDIGRQ